MNSVKYIFFLVLCLLVACSSTTQPENATNQGTEPSKISTSSLPDQSPAKEAKKIIKKYDATTNIYAVNTKKQLLIAFEIHHHDRLKLANIRKKITSKIKKQFPDLKTEVSTDKKLVIELKDLDKQVSNQSITKQTLEKKVKHLLKLSHEKT